MRGLYDDDLDDDDYYYRSTWRRRLRRDDLRYDDNDAERLDNDRDDDVNESGGDDDVNDPRRDDSRVASAGETPGRETSAGETPGETPADADETSPVVSRGSPGELAERSVFGSGVRVGEMLDEDGPPDVVPRGCCLAVLLSALVWAVLVAAVVWLVIR